MTESGMAKIRCSACGRELKKGEFMAVIGKAPATGWSAPLGRADVILRDIGKVYGEACFKERYRPVEE